MEREGGLDLDAQQCRPGYGIGHSVVGNRWRRRERAKPMESGMNWGSTKRRLERRNVVKHYDYNVSSLSHSPNNSSSSASASPTHGSGLVQSAQDPVEGVAEHYERVIATDVGEAQLIFAMPHPRVHYVHTPQSMLEDEMVALMGGNNRVDLITVATAGHWFDLPKFYKLAKCLLRKPGGILAVWAYNDIIVNPEFNTAAEEKANEIPISAEEMAKMTPSWM
ncbi:hypothetical protein NL676_014223 [Syzygium grande]|nr:hypothetical protein NL676_014223 [Syzygium grande]